MVTTYNLNIFLIFLSEHINNCLGINNYLPLKTRSIVLIRLKNILSSDISGGACKRPLPLNNVYGEECISRARVLNGVNGFVVEEKNLKAMIAVVVLPYVLQT